MSESRPVVITANWKMYKTIEESVEYVKALAPLVKNCSAKVYLAVPFTAIRSLADQAKDTNIVIGAQNLNDASEGAFTGEIAARMLTEAGAQFVIVGHSERRRIFNESNAFINRKVKRALAGGLQAILCIGETKAEHEEGKMETVLEEQLTQCLEGISAEQMRLLILAYEPVWAIGTDLTATPEVAEKAHKFCRELIGKNWGEEAAEKIVIQYGGSVKPDNAKGLLDEPDIDGFLVGGASLNPETFSKIVTLNE